MPATMRTCGRKLTIAIWPMCSPSKAKSRRPLPTSWRRSSRLTRRKPSSSHPRLIWRLSTFTAGRSQFCLRQLSAPRTIQICGRQLNFWMKRSSAIPHFSTLTVSSPMPTNNFMQYGYDHTPARLALAEAAVQAATRLRPDAAETHLARAQYLYFGLRDYAGALAQLEIARRGLPNDPRLFELTGYILRRRGQQEEGLQNLQRAVELDPRNFDTLQQIALSYQFLGRYAESIAALDRALAIVPENAETRADRGLVYLFWKADTRPLHQTIDAILAQGPGAIVSAAVIWFVCALAERDPAAAERALVALGDNPCVFERAIILSHSFGQGLLARMNKDEARARSAFETARAQQEKIVQAKPDYGPALCVLGLIDDALGRKDLALDEGA